MSHFQDQPEHIHDASDSESDEEEEEECPYTHYRKCTLGMTLANTLDQLEDDGKISSDLKRETLEQFDRSIYNALKNKIKNKLTMKGDIHTYRSLDNVCMFLCSKIHVKFDAHNRMELDSGRIVAIEDINKTDSARRQKRRKSK